MNYIGSIQVTFCTLATLIVVAKSSTFSPAARKRLGLLLGISSLGGSLTSAIWGTVGAKFYGKNDLVSTLGTGSI